MNERESSLRNKLGIPADAERVLILEQSAHCDWDWVVTFDEYYGVENNKSGHQPVRTTLNDALAQIAGGKFTYVYCEVAYLQAYMSDAAVSTENKDALRAAAGKTFLFSSGGITSAENLTLHTESFIRNYLLGRQWLTQTFGVSASNQMWIPDDFGHDAQLPALLQAMGFTGAGFERIPAQAFAPNTPCHGVTPLSSAPSEYLNASVGLDFIWQAADGSKIQAHWLSGGYCAGNGAFNLNSSQDGGTITSQRATSGIEELIAQSSPPATPNVPYMFSPIDCDFTAPYTNLPDVIGTWNGAPAIPGTYVVLASFDAFMELVANSSMALDTLSASGGTYPFIPHPYYSGCYGSKPLLKRAHYAAVRTLLFAETMQLILQARGTTGDLQPIDDAWEAVMPSTHHDYITGTSPNGTGCSSTSTEDVYRNEQVLRLGEALTAAEAAKEAVLLQIAELQVPGQPGQAAVVVFNPLAFQRTGIARLDVVPAGGPWLSSTGDFETFHPVQGDGGRGLLLQATVPAMGYQTVFLTTRQPNASTGLTASQPTSGPVTMTNAALNAVIGATGITTLTDPANPQSPNYLSAPADVAFYNDRGNIYRFGMEIVCPSTAQFNLDTTLNLSGTITMTESGPLRAKAVQTQTFASEPYTITYELYATDTAIRVTIDGAAPPWYSVMARVPFAGTPASLTYGTTSHWDTQKPRADFDWTPPATTVPMTFEPTHEYVAPLDADGNILGAVYHYATPGWAIQPQSSAILGSILRNNEGTQQAACGTDPDPHTVSYAIAPPVGLQLPDSGAASDGSILAAALDVNNPLEAVTVPANAGARVPRNMRIAWASDPRAIVTVAKAGTLDPSKLILRIYQPTNEVLRAVRITIDAAIAENYRSGGVLVATAVTAIEEPSTLDLNITTEASAVTLDLQFAITTIALG